MSRKKFNDEAKRIKRKFFLTAQEARNRLAQKMGYANFSAMESVMVEQKQWK